MLFAAHSIIGGVVGSELENPFLAFLAGFVLHFLLDTIPHYDTTDGGKFTRRQIVLILVDAIVGLSIIFFYIKPAALSFWYGALGGITPDLLDLTPFWSKAFRKTFFGKNFHRFHDVIQSYKVSLFFGLLIQYLAILLFVIVR
jgi:hypothetical protein